MRATPTFTIEAVPAPAKKTPRPKQGRRLLVMPCANCGTEFISVRANSVFCSPDCGEVAKAVRFIRTEIRNGVGAEPDAPENVLYALRNKLYGVDGIGYRTVRTVPAALRNQVIERDGGRCTQCGKPGTDVDHMPGSILNTEFGTLNRLRLLCADCHRRITLANHGEY